MLIAPERNAHWTRTDLTVSERYLIVAKRKIQAADKHDFFVYFIFHAAAGTAASFVETREATAALNRSVDRFLSYVARHDFFPSAVTSPGTIPTILSRYCQLFARALWSNYVWISPPCSGGPMCPPSRTGDHTGSPLLKYAILNHYPRV